MIDIYAIMQTELNSSAKAFDCNTDCIRKFGMLCIRRQNDMKLVAVITHDGEVNRFGLDASYQPVARDGTAKLITTTTGRINPKRGSKL
jgi:hypothetical protein